MSKNKITLLIDRFMLGEVPRKGVWFRYGNISIMNCGEFAKTHPLPYGMFLGWEALLENDDIVRAETVQDLFNKINHLTQNK